VCAIETRKVDKELHKAIVKAGNATITVLNTFTNNRYTYKIKKCKDENIWFVSLMTGPDNTRSYKYIGSLFGDEFYTTSKSKLPNNDVRVKEFEFVWLNICRNSIPDFVELWHAGRCCVCGKRLTVPKSIELGIGPKCAKRFNIKEEVSSGTSNNP